LYNWSILLHKHLSCASIFEKLVAEASAPKSMALPMKSGSFTKLAFIQEKMSNVEGSEGSADVEPRNYSRVLA
jgi:hypothetical protein